MSRAINFSLAPDSVTETCRKLSVEISAIEKLPSGGTRLVCSTSEGAHALRTKLRTKIVDGRTARTPLFPAHRPW